MYRVYKIKLNNYTYIDSLKIQNYAFIMWILPNFRRGFSYGKIKQKHEKIFDISHQLTKFKVVLRRINIPLNREVS